jgi:hypothetical protein
VLRASALEGGVDLLGLRALTEDDEWDRANAPASTAPTHLG